MKQLGFILCSIFILVSPVFGKAAFPIHLGGFVLGDDISNYKDKIEMESCRALRHMEYMEEGELGNLPAGFKSGLVAFGTCDNPNKIIRIKLKYEDGSKGFFKKLKKQFEKSFGDPDEYMGDPFQIVIGWKWSFEDGKGGRISLILQHNAMDPEEKIGNAVKLSLTSQMDRERICFEAKQPKDMTPAKRVKGNPQWNIFVPY